MKLPPYKTTNFAKWVPKLKPTINGFNFKQGTINGTWFSTKGRHRFFIFLPLL